MWRAELRKALTVRSTLWLWVAAVAVIAVGAFTTASSATVAQLGRPVREQEFFLLSSINLSLFALIVGIRSATEEFRHGTIVWAVLTATDRRGFVLAKAVVAAALGGAIAVTATAGMVTMAMVAAAVKGAAAPEVGAADVGALAGLVAATALWAAIGVAAGMLIRHPVGAAVTAVVWVLAIENLGGGILGDGARFLPGQAGHGLAAVGAADSLLAPLAGGAVMVVYTVALLAAAAITLVRRPITTGV